MTLPEIQQLKKQLIACEELSHDLLTVSIEIIKGDTILSRLSVLSKILQEKAITNQIHKAFKAIAIISTTYQNMSSIKEFDAFLQNIKREVSRIDDRFKSLSKKYPDSERVTSLKRQFSKKIVTIRALLTKLRFSFIGNFSKGHDSKATMAEELTQLRKRRNFTKGLKRTYELHYQHPIFYVDNKKVQFEFTITPLKAYDQLYDFFKKSVEKEVYKSMTPEDYVHSKLHENFYYVLHQGWDEFLLDFMKVIATIAEQALKNAPYAVTGSAQILIEIKNLDIYAGAASFDDDRKTSIIPRGRMWLDFEYCYKRYLCYMRDIPFADFDATVVHEMMHLIDKPDPNKLRSEGFAKLADHISTELRNNHEITLLDYAHAQHYPAQYEQGFRLAMLILAFSLKDNAIFMKKAISTEVSKNLDAFAKVYLQETYRKDWQKRQELFRKVLDQVVREGMFKNIYGPQILTDEYAIRMALQKKQVVLVILKKDFHTIKNTLKQLRLMSWDKFSQKAGEAAKYFKVNIMDDLEYSPLGFAG